MELFAVGLNYQSAPLALRERLAFPAEQLQEALRALAQRVQAPEAAILSTCNRTEVYCAASNIEQLKIDLLEWLAVNRNIPTTELGPHLYILPQQEVVRHAFRVASGLDSMVLGEAQILGQMKQAARTAEEAGTLGQMLHQLFQRTFSVAKEVRSHTEIGAHSVSMASAAVKLATRMFGDLGKRNVLFIGAGEMIQLCATHFAAQNPKSITIANRSADRANQLAQTHGASVIGLAQVPEQLAKSDIVISCTASTLPIVGKGMVEQALKKRRHKPMFLVDLAVPRDIEAQVSELEDAYLYTVDDLQNIVSQNMQSRQHAATQAEQMIAAGVTEFSQWLQLQDNIDWVRDYRERCESVKTELVQRALNQLASGQDAERVLQELATKLSNRLMHAPTKTIRHLLQDEQVEAKTLINFLVDI